jgi:hypothetical protein
MYRRIRSEALGERRQGAAEAEEAEETKEPEEKILLGCN